MIVAEQLVLLALEPERGVFARGVQPVRLRSGAAAAILADMILHKRIARSGDGIELADALPDFHPLLSEGAVLLAHGPRQRSIADAIHRVERGIGSLLKRLLRSLTARDILHDEREAFVLHRYPVRSMQALREVFEHVHAVEAGRNPQPAHVALAAIADACGVLDVRLSPEERMKVRRHVEGSSEDLQLILEISRVLARTS